jgi:hypothetical protein
MLTFFLVDEVGMDVKSKIRVLAFHLQALYEAGVKRKGTDVVTWIAIMSERSVPHLQKGTSSPKH